MSRSGQKRYSEGLVVDHEHVMCHHPMYAVDKDHPYMQVQTVASWGQPARFICPIAHGCNKMQTHQYISKLEEHALSHLKMGNATEGSALELLAFALGRKCPGLDHAVVAPAHAVACIALTGTAVEIVQLYAMMRDTQGQTVIEKVNKKIEQEADRLLRKICEELDTRGLTKDAQVAVQTKLDALLTTTHRIDDNVQAVQQAVGVAQQDLADGLRMLKTELAKKKGLSMTCPSYTVITFIEYKPLEMLWNEDTGGLLWQCTTCETTTLQDDITKDNPDEMSINLVYEPTALKQITNAYENLPVPPATQATQDIKTLCETMGMDALCNVCAEPFELQPTACNQDCQNNCP
jgi:hypothetical protein